MVKKVHSKEPETCNMNGRKGLDPDRMALVKRLTYHHRQVKEGETEDDNLRKTCIMYNTK